MHVGLRSKCNGYPQDRRTCVLWLETIEQQALLSPDTKSYLVVAVQNAAVLLLLAYLVRIAGYRLGGRYST